MREIGPIAEAHGASPGQIVIAWTLQQPGITFSLCGARNPDQARENAGRGASACHPPTSKRSARQPRAI